MTRLPLAGGIAALVIMGCSTTQEAQNVEPGTEVATTAATPTAEAPDAFARGESLYAGSDYTGAAAAYEEHLTAHPDDPRNDVLLLRLGMIYLVRGAPTIQVERGEHVLGVLAERFPSSPLRDAGDYVLDLRRENRTLQADAELERQEIERLEAQIEALKRIDLGNEDEQR